VVLLALPSLNYPQPIPATNQKDPKTTQLLPNTPGRQQFAPKLEDLAEQIGKMKSLVREISLLVTPRNDGAIHVGATRIGARRGRADSDQLAHSAAASTAWRSGNWMDARSVPTNVAVT